MNRLPHDVTRCAGVRHMPPAARCPDRNRCALHRDTPSGVMLSFVALRREPTMREPCAHFIEYSEPSA